MNEPSHRRGRVRWLIVAGTALVGLCVIGWYFSNAPDAEILAKASGIELGQHIGDVLHQMKGTRKQMEVAPTGELAFQFVPDPSAVDVWLYRFKRFVLQLPASTTSTRIAVEIQFDRDERVCWIRRGRETVGTKR